MWGVFIKVKMTRRPSGKYPEMPMRVTDRRMSLVNATPQKYNPAIFFYYMTWEYFWLHIDVVLLA